MATSKTSVVPVATKAVPTARTVPKVRKRTGSATDVQQTSNPRVSAQATKRVKRFEAPDPAEIPEEKKGQSPYAKRSRKARSGKVPPQLRAYSFKPGQSGNPKGGRSGRLSLTKRLRQLLSQPAFANDPDGQTKADVVVEMAVQAAAQGDSNFFKEIMNRIDGKVSDHVIIDSAKRMVEQQAADLSAKVVEIAFEVVDKYIADESEAAAFIAELSEQLLARLNVTPALNPPESLTEVAVEVEE